MKSDIDKMLKVWDKIQAELPVTPHLPKINLDEIVSSVFAMGPFYYYLINFPDTSISDISSGFEKAHGIPRENVTHVHDILALMHPDDMEFVSKAEEEAHRHIFQMGVEKATRYKASYNFRFKTADGTYRLFNHQSLILSIDESKSVIQSINIHTDISHITTKNNHKWSAIGLAGEPSYLNMAVWDDDNSSDKLELRFSQRQLEVMRLIVKGHNTKQIAEMLCITVDTVKAHRKHIMEKSGCHNMAELAARSISEGWV